MLALPDFKAITTESISTSELGAKDEKSMVTDNNKIPKKFLIPEFLIFS